MNLAQLLQGVNLLRALKLPKKLTLVHQVYWRSWKSPNNTCCGGRDTGPRMLIRDSLIWDMTTSFIRQIVFSIHRFFGWTLFRMIRREIVEPPHQQNDLKSNENAQVEKQKNEIDRSRISRNSLIHAPSKNRCVSRDHVEVPEIRSSGPLASQPHNLHAGTIVHQGMMIIRSRDDG